MVTKNAAEKLAGDGARHGLGIFKLKNAVANIGVKAAVPDEMQDVERLTARAFAESLQRGAGHPFKRKYAFVFKYRQRKFSAVPLSLGIETWQISGAGQDH